MTTGRIYDDSLTKSLHHNEDIPFRVVVIKCEPYLLCVTEDWMNDNERGICKGY